MNIAEAAGGSFRAVDRLFKNIEPENGIIQIRLIGTDKLGAIIQAMEVGLMSELQEPGKAG